MSFDSSRTSSQQPVDHLSNYELHEEISRGARSIVYRATCKRGRLRNRQVAIKKTTLESNQGVPHSKGSLSLYSALCHPSIVSLISSFSSPSGNFQVLELCQRGSLSDILHQRNPATLTEEELRGIARTLVDALIYLRKERVIHGDIKPSNILVNEECRVKLSGFSFAVRLPPTKSTITTFCGSANYISPEILSGTPYDFKTDIWSLGCVFVTCLAGSPPFCAATPQEVFDNICCARYVLPDTISYEAQDLISGLLQKNQQDRTPLHRILSHPFFKPSLSAKPLLAVGLEPHRISNFQQTSLSSENVPSLPCRQYPSSISKDPLRLRPIANKFAAKAAAHNRTPLQDITNVHLSDHQIMRDAPTRQDILPTVIPPSNPRRVTTLIDGKYVGTDSRPPTPALTADSGTPSASSLPDSYKPDNRHILLSRASLGQIPPASPRTQLRRVLSDPYQPALAFSSNAIAPSAGTRPLISASDPLGPRVVSKATSSTVVSQASTSTLDRTPSWNKQVGDLLHHLQIPIGQADGLSSRICTRRLKSQTHKVARGQLVVLPSKSLLVDFREGERRSGRNGREVLMINSDGKTVQVYDAPHLSTPCCLVEPVATYSFNNIPSTYAKLYDDAAKLVDQLNARIPKLVHFCEDAKCTLMANGPPGDVEVLIPGGEEAEGLGEREEIRFRLRRCRQTLEISRHIARTPRTGKDTGEWSKKVVPLNDLQRISGEGSLAFDFLEKLAMRHLSDFLQICEAAEVVEADTGASVGIVSDRRETDGRERLERALQHVATQPKANAPGERPISPSCTTRSRASSRISALQAIVPPRPNKFSGKVLLR